MANGVEVTVVVNEPSRGLEIGAVYERKGTGQYYLCVVHRGVPMAGSSIGKKEAVLVNLGTGERFATPDECSRCLGQFKRVPDGTVLTLTVGCG